MKTAFQQIGATEIHSPPATAIQGTLVTVNVNVYIKASRLPVSVDVLVVLADTNHAMMGTSHRRTRRQMIRPRERKSSTMYYISCQPADHDSDMDDSPDDSMGTNAGSEGSADLDSNSENSHTEANSDTESDCTTASSTSPTGSSDSE